MQNTEMESGPKTYEGDWKCQDCGYNNFANRFRCRQCGWSSKGTNEGEGEARRQPTARPGDWICVCGVHNFSYRKDCYGCSRPLHQNNRLLGEWKKGDWLCTDCNYHNYSKNATCRKCEAQRS